MHKVTFEDDVDGKRRYEMCFQAIALAPRDLKIPVNEWDDVVALIKKLKAIGEEANEKVGGKPLYELQDGGGELTLERSEMKVMIGFVEQPVWRPLAIEEAQELATWLKSVPRDAASLRRDAKPEAKRKAANLEK